MIWNGLHKDWIAAQEAKRAAAEAVAAADTSAAAVDAENRAAVEAREARDGEGFGDEEEQEEEGGTEGGEVRMESHVCVVVGMGGGGRVVWALGGSFRTFSEPGTEGGEVRHGWRGKGVLVGSNRVRPGIVGGAASHGGGGVCV
jgi:hypothetical protein